MQCVRCLAAVLLVLTFAPAARAQGELVIVTEGTKQYHRPACPLVRDAKDVVAMTVGQAESRGFKAHASCDPKVAGGGGNTSSGAGAAAPVYVYTAAGDRRYHRESCARLPKERKRVLLEEAGKKLWPCSVCRPPIRKRTPAIPR